MDDTITIRTSDDPPIRLEASRAVLAANSKVFADMLSIPQPSSDASSTIDISETADQMKPFLGVLNLSHSPANPLDELDDTVWPIIARLAEKYDSATTREIVMGKCWKWKCGIDDADNATQLFAAFETAAILGQPCLAKVFLFAYLQQSSRAEIVEALKPWGARFDPWAAQLKEHAQAAALSAPPAIECAKCSKAGCYAAWAVELAWYRLMRGAMLSWDSLKIAAPFRRFAGVESRKTRLCAECQSAFSSCVQKFEEKYRNEAPDFPL